MPLHHRRAFTLLEVIVAMAIMGIAVGMMIPVVSKARSRSQEIFCQSNLRTISIGLMQYTIDYDDRYPFGFTFNKFNSSTARPVFPDISYITWYSSADRYLTSGANEIIPLDANSGFVDGATTRRFHAAFRCPAVPAQYRQQVQYYQHGVVMPHTTLEVPIQFRAPGLPIIKPAKLNQLYPHTALVWDTQVWSDAAPVSPSMFWGSDHTVTGLAPFVTYVDDNNATGGSTDSLLDHPELPERRYRGPGGDRFAASVNALKNPAGPIAYPSDQYLQSIGSQPINADGSGTIFNPGSPRFRHASLGCNVLFADGSVRTLHLRPWRKVAFGAPGTGAANYVDSDFRRYMLMIKWPPGIYDTNTYSTN